MLAGFLLLFCFFIAFIVAGIRFYNDFDQFHNHISLLVHANKLSNLSLEIRRYEKNFIMTHDLKDYTIAQSYIRETLGYLSQTIPLLAPKTPPNHLQQFATNFKKYRTAFLKLKTTTDCLHQGQAVCTEVKNTGRELIQISDAFIADQHFKMAHFINLFKLQLIVYLSLLVLFSIITFLYVYKNIIIPLKTIQKAAQVILPDSLSSVKISRDTDEAQTILQTCQKMMAEFEIQQEQLFEEKKLASLVTLASGAAHQLNNPLNNISTSSQIAQAELENDNLGFIRKLLLTIEDEAERAGEIVRSLLEYSRKKQPLTIQPASLTKVIEKAIRLVQNEVPEGIQIVNSVSKKITLPMDVQKMLEVFLNLLINALQSTDPPGKIMLSAIVDENKTRVITRVRDTGNGIEPGDLALVFEPFFSTKSEKKGTGLGLAIVNSIVIQHGGTIRVESQKDMGTVFIITLPLGPNSTGCDTQKE